MRSVCSGVSLLAIQCKSPSCLHNFLLLIIHLIQLAIKFVTALNESSKTAALRNEQSSVMRVTLE